MKEGEGKGDKNGGKQGANQFKDTEVGEKDEKFDAQYTGTEAERVKNPNEAKAKEAIKDRQLAPMEPVENKDRQPVPLEYRDLLK